LSRARHIRGETKEPIAYYVKKPNVTYQEDLPSVHAEDPGSPRKTKTRHGDQMMQPQNL